MEWKIGEEGIERHVPEADISTLLNLNKEGGERDGGPGRKKYFSFHAVFVIRYAPPNRLISWTYGIP